VRDPSLQPVRDPSLATATPPAPSASPAPAVAAATPAATPAPAAPPAPALIVVSVTNPLAEKRGPETVVLALRDLETIVHGIVPQKTLVFDAAGKAVRSQLIDSDGDEALDQLVFQSDFGPSETKSFQLRSGERSHSPRDDFKVYGRFVRERHDDFAWENDLVAHRMYGPDLETYKKEPLVSSGIDVWSKKTPRLLINEWYMTDDYHQDKGDGADFYSVGKSRGCGGLGIWAGGKLHVSRNFVSSRVLANGPIRLIFELSYAPWDAGGVRVGETKRITLDAGTPFNQFQSTFTKQARPISVALGIAKHPGASVKAEAKSGFLQTWEPVKEGQNGNLGCAIVLPPGVAADPQQSDTDTLLVTQVKAPEPLTYHVGSTWDRGGRVANALAWEGEVRALSSRIGAPLRVSLSAAAH